MKKPDIISTIKTVMPAVVSIAVAKHLEDIEREIPREIAPLLPYQQDGHLQVPDEMLDAKGMVRIGGGSGFIVTDNGLIVTNKHVVSDAEAEYTVILDNGEKFPASILARDPIDDIAIIKIAPPESRTLPTVKLGDSNRLDLGQTVMAIGNALGIFKNTVSSGIVSGLSRSIRAAAENEKHEPTMQELRGLIQTDAAINPGNSGGPLVNLAGEAIGINAAIVFGAQNLGFAIPINAVKRDLEDHHTHGRIRRPLLGLRYLTIDEGLQLKMKLPVARGALVASQPPHAIGVIPGSPADKAGIRDRDIITSCNGEPLTEDKNLQDFLETMEVGDVMRLALLRGGKEKQVSVTLAERK